jgi:hypothetical protein
MNEKYRLPVVALIALAVVAVVVVAVSRTWLPRFERNERGATPSPR